MKKSRQLFLSDIYRLQPGQSFFDTLPAQVADYKVQYTEACQCTAKGTGGNQVCENAFDVAFPTVLKKNLSPMFLCDRQKRDINCSDDPTDEDFQLFKQTPSLSFGFKRDVLNEQISKENATRYCAQRINETKVGKLCAKVGVNVQVLVDVCASDVEVSYETLFQNGESLNIHLDALE